MRSSSLTRVGFRWNVNEILSLQREFELLGWSIDEIAQKHKRTPNAIMLKLDQEGFADYNVLYSDYYFNNIMTNENTSNLSLEHNNNYEDNESQLDYDSEDEEHVENADCEDNDEVSLSERVYCLEESVSEIRDIIKQMMKTFNKSSTTKSWF